MPATKAPVKKLNLKKEYKHLYLPSAKQVSLVEVPEFQFTMIDGRIEAGVPPAESEEFVDAMTAMYGVAYTLKFMSKLHPEYPLDFTVMAVEGLWSTKSGGFAFEADQPWLFTLLMMQPPHITQPMFEDALEQAAARRPNPAFEHIRMAKWCEGLSIQVMHIGPYADEPASVAKLDRYAEEHGLEKHGRHHEIYLGDPRRAKPERLRTVIRHPVRVK